MYSTDNGAEVIRDDRLASYGQYDQPIETTTPTSVRAASGFGGSLSKV
jgi:hypothetical protein